MATQVGENSVDLSNTATVRTINSAELLKQAPHALKELLLAATEDGVFYLNFENKDGLDRILQDVDRLSHALFDLPIEEKMVFDIDEMSKLKLNGYKPMGRNKGGMDGHLDGFESYAISQDSIRAPSGLAARHPAVIAEYGESLTQLTSTCLEMTQLILKALSKAFELPADDSFESRHDSVTSPLDLLRLLKYHNAIGNSVFSIPQLGHADIGSLTFLFTSSPGLQILPPGTEMWRNVLPKPGHAIVNFGDTMKILSGGKIESSMHRVVTMPGNEMRDRYSFAFLVRPVPSALITSLPGFRSEVVEKARPPMTCEEWVSMRFGQMRAK